jgi:imidazoleglycerol-phosphate dehydratase
MSTIERETRETSIRVTVLREGGEITVDTGVPFLDHMLLTWARYAGVGLALHARGDLRHHLIEDVGIALGAALKGAIPATAARYGHRIIPMDEALVECAIDVGGRYYYEGPLPSTLYDHFMRSFAEHAGSTLHLRVLRGTDRHHIVEGAFKALGLAIRDALVDSGAVFSTKGSVALRRDRGDAGTTAQEDAHTGEAEGVRVAATSARSEGPSRTPRTGGAS